MLSKRAPLGVLSFALVTFILVSSANAQRSSYGEACSKTLRCDRRSWLGCFSGKCDCVKPDEMVFEPSTRKCASKAGERCKYALEHSDGSKSFEYTNCVEHSVCGDDGFCTCNEEFYETFNGTCSRKGRFSVPCDEQAKCSATFGLVCNNGTCECEDKTSIYSDEEEQCVGLVGHSCVASKCTQNANCSNSKCVCGEDYYHNSEDKCSQRKGLQEKCVDDDQCKQTFPLKCMGGICVCNSDVSIFGTAKRHAKTNYNCHRHGNFYGFETDSQTQCLGKVNSPCVQGLCAPGSFCMFDQPCHQQSPSLAGTCTCLSGYTPSPRGTCGVGHGQGCDSANVCISGMACKYHSYYQHQQPYRCACRYSNQNYDSTLKKCISPAGGPCDENSSCTQGTECETFENGLKGTCKCKPGHVQGSSGTCLADFGMPCNSTNTCDPFSGLACIEYTCQCDGFQEFSPKLQKCLGLVGSECVLKAEGQCVENARCMKIRDALTVGNCRCTEGFSVSDNYTCIVAATESVPVLAFPVVYDVDTSDSDEV